MNYSRLARSVISGRTLSRKTALSILAASGDDSLSLIEAAWHVRRHFFGRRVQVQVLSNAKSGICTEDCHYCSQSSVSSAGIARYGLKTVEELVSEAANAKMLHAHRFCMGMSGLTLSDPEVDALCGAVSAIKEKTGIPVCCSLGFLTSDQARRLRASGLDRVNHNLNTSERHYPNICTTHTWAKRVRNLEICREAGLELCSGGIIGQGETDEDIADMLMTLAKIRPESVPINFLIPVKGTPFETLETGLTPMRCLKVLALARLLNPAADIRVAGGREVHLKSLQPLALFIVNSIFVNGYLTEGGQPQDEALRMIEDAGFEIEA
jgi:biotin synthase